MVSSILRPQSIPFLQSDPCHPAQDVQEDQTDTKWSLYGELYDEVLRLLEGTNLRPQFHGDDGEKSCTRT